MRPRRWAPAAALLMLAFAANVDSAWAALPGSVGELSLVDHTVIVTPGMDMVFDVRTSSPEPPETFKVAVRAVSGELDAATLDAALTDADTQFEDVVELTDVGEWSDGGTLRLTVPTETAGDTAGRLAFPKSGPYVVLVSGAGSAFTTLVVAGAHSVPVAFGAMVDSTLTLQPDGTSTIDPAVRAQLTRLADILETSGVPISVTIRPELLNGLAESGVPGDPELVARLGAALGGDNLLAAPYVALDPSAAAAAGLDDVFKEQLRSGEDALGALLGHFPLRVVWMAADPLTVDGELLMRDLGAKVIVRLEGAGIPPPGLASGDQRDPALPVILPDPVGYRLGHGSPDPELAAHVLAAQLVVEHQDDAGAVVMVDLATADPGTLDALLAIGAASNGLVPSAIQGTVRASEAPVLLTDASGSVVPDLTRAAALRDDLHALALTTQELLTPGDARGQRWPALADAILDSHLTDEARADFARSLRALMTGIQTHVELLSPTSVNLSGRSTPVPIAVRNGNDFPVVVAVRLTSPKLRSTSISGPVTVPAGETVQLRVPVEIRSNGRFPVTAELVTVDSAQRVGNSATFSVRASGLTGLGIVLTFAAGLVLATWWVQHLRRRSRRRGEGEAKERHPMASGSVPSNS